MFSRGEIRLLGLTVALFLAGLGWRSAQARLSLPPLEVHGTPLEWSSGPASPVDDSATGTNANEAASIPLGGSSTHGVRKITGSLDPNQATVAQLRTLPGIGPALALRIAEERTHAPFREADDLLRVKGIGPAKIESLRSHLLF